MAMHNDTLIDYKTQTPPKLGSMSDLPIRAERRKHKRFPMELPLIFQPDRSWNTSAGLVINASQTGLQIQTMKEMSVCEKLNFEIFFQIFIYFYTISCYNTREKALDLRL